MSKTTARPFKSTRSTNVYRMGSLLAIGLVAILGAYAMTNDIGYSTQSLIAAVAGAFNPAPRIVISRDLSMPERMIYPSDHALLAVYNVTSRNATSTTYLNDAVISVTVSPAGTGLAVDFFNVSYTSCSDVCKTSKVPLASVVRSGDTYTLTIKGAKLPVPLNTSNSTLAIYAGPYYPGAYTGAQPLLGNVKADIESASGSVMMSTWLAYGTSLQVFRGVGFGFGDYDYINDGDFNIGDVTYLKRVALGDLGCPLHKVCDVNKDKVVNVADVVALTALLTSSKK